MYKFTSYSIQACKEWMYTTRSKNTKMQRIQKMTKLSAETTGGKSFRRSSKGRTCRGRLVRRGLSSWSLEKRVTFLELVDFTLNLWGLKISPYNTPVKVRVLEEAGIEHYNPGFGGSILLVKGGNFCDLLLMIFMCKLQSRSSCSKLLPGTLQVKL